MKLVDSHCHLDYPDFSHDWPSCVLRANKNNVAMMLMISTKISSFERVKELASQFNCLYCTVGIHPHEADKELIDDDEILEKMTKNHKVIGIGETGLDYFYQYAHPKNQKYNFYKHIKCAQKTGLPLIIHTRNADEDTMDILEKEYKKKKFTGLIHCFSSSKKLALRALDLGFYISCSGIITFKKSQELRDIVQEIPLNRLLVETDAPYLSPVPKRGKSNEPAYVTHTAKVLSEIKNCSYEDIAKQTTQNFFKLFTKANQSFLEDINA